MILKMRLTKNDIRILAMTPYNRKKLIRKNSKLLFLKYISCSKFKSVTVAEKKKSK